MSRRFNFRVARPGKNIIPSGKSRRLSPYHPGFILWVYEKHKQRIKEEFSWCLPGTPSDPVGREATCSPDQAAKTRLQRAG